ncbi:hypothetical protein OJ996_11095 [Luteolibacter sp. GHJ8]|uniref:Uncharacterized protein n=1 Tax=Luteolibacter rhizosphaerae TaxID=2989719 RepID=A0ABT3G2Q1_9BACT|nr:hypothetical protein [Luteolibacter rhizosphaerae]MCW1914125.1 hypothetical protein [Luteolibacter rhizosphaerae]
MSPDLYERLSDRATMWAAQKELLGMGEEAIPVLAALLGGEAKNEFGVPYRELPPNLSSALALTKALGMHAKPLEAFLRAELNGPAAAFAAAALAALESLEDASIPPLVACLEGPQDIAFESAVALIQHGHAEHPAVLAALENSARARFVWRSIMASQG